MNKKEIIRVIAKEDIFSASVIEDIKEPNLSGNIIQLLPSIRHDIKFKEHFTKWILVNHIGLVNRYDILNSEFPKALLLSLELDYIKEVLDEL